MRGSPAPNANLKRNKAPNNRWSDLFKSLLGPLVSPALQAGTAVPKDNAQEITQLAAENHPILNILSVLLPF